MTAVCAPASNIACICIDRAVPKRERARLYSCYQKTPLVVDDIGRLPIVLEELLETVDFPQASAESRSFITPRRKHFRGEAKQLMSEENVKIQRGEKASFIVQILHRQYASWQGKVTWVEKNKSQNFRSALELLKLIDGALAQEEEAEGLTEEEHFAQVPEKATR